MPSFRVLLMSLLCLSWPICKPGRVFVQPIMLDTPHLEQCGARMHVPNYATLEGQVETKGDTLRLRVKFAWGLAMVVVWKANLGSSANLYERTALVAVIGFVVPDQLEFLPMSRDSFVLHLMRNILTFKADVRTHTNLKLTAPGHLCVLLHKGCKVFLLERFLEYLVPPVRQRCYCDELGACAEIQAKNCVLVVCSIPCTISCVRGIRVKLKRLDWYYGESAANWIP